MRCLEKIADLEPNPYHAACPSLRILKSALRCSEHEDFGLVQTALFLGPVFMKLLRHRNKPGVGSTPSVSDPPLRFQQF
jgi:hypothetical protein